MDTWILKCLLVIYSCILSLSIHFPAGRDFRPDPYTVTFTAGQQYASVMVSPIDDDTAELLEYFSVIIYSVDKPAVVEIGSPNTAVIAIEDNDGVFHVCVHVCA